jgi:NADPH:quinone reductase-like Zn-dependent oxidoreductase
MPSNNSRDTFLNHPNFITFILYVMSPSMNLPLPVAQFIESIHDNDSSKLISTFAPSPVMIDESKSYNTKEAIKHWADEALIAHKATVTVQSTTINDAKDRVSIHLMMDGDFVKDYGITEPFPLYFHFELTSTRDKIQKLRIDDLAPDEPTMKAVWATGGGAEDPIVAIRTGLRRVPKVPDGWVKIKLSAVGLNFHDIFTLRGLGFHPVEFPRILGNEGAGTLEDGSEVLIYPLMPNPEFKGDDVTLDPRRHVLGELTQGALAEYVVVPKECVVPKPKGLSNAAAASLGIAWLAAYRMLFTHAKVTKGQKILVQGSAGGVATALIQLGLAAGVEVWTTGRTEEKRAVAAKLGAHQTFESGADLPELVDAVFDMSGAQTLNHSVASARAGGTVVLCGVHSGNPSMEFDLRRFFLKQIKLTGSYLGTREEFEALIKFVEEKGIVPEVALVLPLEEAEDGFRKMLEGRVLGKVVVAL